MNLSREMTESMGGVGVMYGESMKAASLRREAAGSKSHSS